VIAHRGACGPIWHQRSDDLPRDERIGTTLPPRDRIDVRLAARKVASRLAVLLQGTRRRSMDDANAAPSRRVADAALRSTMAAMRHDRTRGADKLRKVRKIFATSPVPFFKKASSARHAVAK